MTADSETSVEIMGILQALNAQQRITIVLVTHEPDIVRYAERVIVFKDGLVIEDRRSAGAQTGVGGESLCLSSRRSEVSRKPHGAV